MEDSQKSLQESLLPEQIEDKAQVSAFLTWDVFTEEGKKLFYIAGPMVTVTLSLYLINVISMMMVGHLGELALSSSAIAISLSAVTGFSLMVIMYPFLTFLPYFFASVLLISSLT